MYNFWGGGGEEGLAADEYSVTLQHNHLFSKSFVLECHWEIFLRCGF